MVVRVDRAVALAGGQGNTAAGVRTVRTEDCVLTGC